MVSIMDVNSAAQVPIIEPLDAAFIEATLSAPPFRQIEGLINVRELPLPPAGGMARGIVLRSGETTLVTETGKSQLLSLAITKIFDLRSVKEISRIQGPPLEIEGIEIVHAPAMPLSRSENMQDAFAKFKVQLGQDPDAAFVDSYDDIFREAVPAFRLIFEHIRDRLPLGEGVLIHCTAGKDRTGAAAMLILDLIGIDRETIARDYALTRIGLESGRGSLIARYHHILTDPDSGQSAVNVFSSRPSAMMATLVLLREKYGGANGYLKKNLGFSEEDVRKMELSLLGEAGP